MRFKAFIPRPFYDRPQEKSFIVAAVIGQVAVRLAEGRNDLRHFQPENSVFIRQRRPVARPVAFIALGRVRPYLNALAGKRLAVPRLTYGALNPKPAAADPLYDGRVRLVVIRPATHKPHRC